MRVYVHNPTMWLRPVPGRDRDLYRDAVATSVGIGIVGASFGAVSAALELPWWQPVAMSVFVFAGTGQFAFVSIVASGGGLVAGVVAALVLNLRHVPYGLAVGDVYWGRWWTRLLGTHVLLDQSTAFALAAGADWRRARVAFWTTGVAIFLTWNLGTVVGFLAGERVADPDAFGLDAAFPASLLALVLPRLKDATLLRSAALGAVIALATTPFLPPGIPVLLALLGLAATVPVRRGERVAS